MYDDEDRETPPAVVGAVAAGTAPLPFLAVYATMFIVHGQFHHVIPPDVTSTDRGELLVGLLCLALFLLGLVTLVWLLNGRRRWPFVLLQAGLLGVAIDFLLDTTKSGPLVSALVGLTSLAAVVLCGHPQAWEHVGLRCPQWLGRLYGQKPPPKVEMPVGSQPTSADRPMSSRLVGRRHRSSGSAD